MSCNAQGNLCLDKEYKIYLGLIRCHILNMKNVQDLQLCKLWIDKLSGCPEKETYLRNSYLKELTRQVMTKTLIEPFSMPPNSGPLHPLSYSKADSKIGTNSSSSWTDISTNNTDHEEASSLKGSGDWIPKIQCCCEVVKDPESFETKTDVLPEMQILSEDIKEESKCHREGKAARDDFTIYMHLILNQLSALKDSLMSIGDINNHLDHRYQDLIKYHQNDMKENFSQVLNEVLQLRISNGKIEDVINIISHTMKTIEASQNKLNMQFMKILQQLIQEIVYKYNITHQKTPEDNKNNSKRLTAIIESLMRRVREKEQQISNLQKEQERLRKKIFNYKNTFKQLERQTQTQVKCLKIELEMQNIELKANSSLTSRRPMNDLLSNLESCYTKTINDVKRRATEQQQRDQQIICHLESEIRFLKQRMAESHSTDEYNQ